jgi:hypothetical protein
MLGDWPGRLLLQIGHVLVNERKKLAPTGGGFLSVLVTAYEVVEDDWFRLPWQSRYNMGRAEAGGTLQTIGVDVSKPLWF